MVDDDRGSGGLAVSALTDWFDKRKPRRSDFVLTDHAMVPAISVLDIAREERVLQQLAVETARSNDSLKAARKLFGGHE